LILVFQSELNSLYSIGKFIFHALAKVIHTKYEISPFFSNFPTQTLTPMSDIFLTFEKFNDPELAATIASQLDMHGISSRIVNEAPVFDPTFANNNFEPTIQLKLRPHDFSKARIALDQHYQEQLADIEPDYYLFSFSDAELLDLVKNADEWGPLDYALAKHLLAEHGSPVSPEQEASFQQERIKILTKPESSQLRWIIAGYIAAFFFGGLAGIILGYILGYLKKTLPDGHQVYVYSSSTRKHGKRIMVISVIFSIYWIWSLMKVSLAPWMKPL